MKKLLLLLFSIVLFSSCVQQVTSSSKTIEGCDYSIVLINGTSGIIHRGDCKGCAEKQEILINRIIEGGRYGGI